MKGSSTHTLHLVGWQETLLRTAHTARQAALVDPASPALDPGAVETLLESLCAHGFSDEAAAAAYQVFSWFLLGHLVVETSPGLQDGGRSPEAGEPGSADVPTGAAFPTTARLAAQLRADAAEEIFEVGLEQLLDRIALYKVTTPVRPDLRGQPVLRP